MIDIIYTANGEIGALKVTWFSGKSPEAVAIECVEDYFLRTHAVPKTLTVKWPDNTKSAFDVDIDTWTFTAKLR